MKRITGILSVALALVVLSPTTEALAADCSATRKTCIEGCNNDYPGDTIFDGAQRAGCRTGCDIGYLWCEIWN